MGSTPRLIGHRLISAETLRFERKFHIRRLSHAEYVDDMAAGRAKENEYPRIFAETFSTDPIL